MTPWKRRITAAFLGWVVLLAGLCWLELSPQPEEPTAIDNPNKGSGQEVEPRSPDDRLADYTLWLTGFTGLLAAVSAFQIFFLFRADKTAAANAEIANRQMLISGQQADILEKQKEIQRQEFLITHRPRMRLRGVSGPSQSKGGKSEFNARFSNVGNTEAHIISSKFLISTLHKFPEIVAVVPDEFLDEDTKVQPGGTFWITKFTDLEPMDITKAVAIPLLVSGSVLYRDGLGRLRTTSFGLRNKPNSVALRDPEGLEDINYED
jgi:hypothetical protein